MIRDFEPRDQEAFRALVLAGLAERWGEAFDPTFNPDLLDIEASYLAQGAVVVVAENDAGLVATGILRPETGNRGRIVRVSVDAGCRRQRLGRRVVEELVTRARQRRMSEVVVLADTPWTSAVDLYRACGFREVASDDRDTHFVLAL